MSKKTSKTMLTENISQDKKGRLKWTYGMSLLKNPTILILLWKIFFWICVGLWIFVLLLDLFDGNLNWDKFISITKFFMLFLLGFEALVLLGYLLYAAIMGGKYSVVFTMDEKEITHAQDTQQFKKAQRISFLTMLLGLLTRQPSAVSAGAVSASRSKMRTRFSSIKRIVINRSRNVIELHERVGHNQVYASDADLDFVIDYIKQRVNPDCIIQDR